MLVGGVVCNNISLDRSKLFVNNQKIVVLDIFFNRLPTLDLATLIYCIQRHLLRLHFKAELTENDFEVKNPDLNVFEEIYIFFDKNWTESQGATYKSVTCLKELDFKFKWNYEINRRIN